ncbi:hypothetical protein FEA48_30785 [Pseudomonas nitroreducens]|uniref:Uncharacterized protein n=1 Tax=Pseudomonas nitroreducens TaxID=46680 RepID=A0A5R8ZQ31_PSENT|nr:hypothetical protein [Pseudomonas nitroreducens]TLP68242.1 hypothetical protein FEA48_30785 [Pseudomonas nitroreducens]
MSGFGFMHSYEFFDAQGNLMWREEIHNQMPQDGVDYAAKALFGDTPAIGVFYVGLYAGNVVPSLALKASDLQSTLLEFTKYSEPSRPQWQRVYDNTSMIDNLASRAEFTITENARLYGGFLVSSNVKGGNTGVLLSVARFDSPRDVTAGGTFKIGAGLGLVPAATY